MPSKVREFPTPANGNAVVPTAESIVVFALGGRKFAIQWIVTELNPRPADVIPIQKQRQRARPRTTQS